jgi:hypothetical protein
MHASLASYAAAAMPALDLRPEIAHAHQPVMSPSHHGWDGNGATAVPTPMPKRYILLTSCYSTSTAQRLRLALG